VIPLGNAIEEDIYVFPQSVLIPTDAHGKVRCVLRRANAETLISAISSRRTQRCRSALVTSGSLPRSGPPLTQLTFEGGNDLRAGPWLARTLPVALVCALLRWRVRKELVCEPSDFATVHPVLRAPQFGIWEMTWRMLAIVPGGRRTSDL
jgi:hypothetical protein